MSLQLHIYVSKVADIYVHVCIYVYMYISTYSYLTKVAILSLYFSWILCYLKFLV